MADNIWSFHGVLDFDDHYLLGYDSVQIGR
jgi:hypothetical protein